MLFGKRPRRRSRPTTNTNAVHWIVIGAVILAFINNTFKAPDENKPKLGETWNKAITEIGAKVPKLGEYKDKVLPQKITQFQTQDTKAGEGTPALCGQEVSIAYEAAVENGTAIANTPTKEKPLRFRLGDRSVMPALEQGVMGMKKNGTRDVFSPPEMAYGHQGFTDSNIPQNTSIRFKVELLDISPPIPDITESLYRIAMIKNGIAQPIICGDKVKIHMTLWDMEGKKRYTTQGEESTPIEFTTGKSEVFLGLEQGVLGMKLGEIRTLIIPLALQKPLIENPNGLNIPLPDKQTVLVDVETVP